MITKPQKKHSEFFFSGQEPIFFFFGYIATLLYGFSLASQSQLKAICQEQKFCFIKVGLIKSKGNTNEETIWGIQVFFYIIFLSNDEIVMMKS